ncbi:YPTM2 [Symbiodinium natans]|uniref:YPTM2 protein n=1 Tax=Symbiodinium natans TaxID=878477 RepID=A0A812PXM3_9DINO|nr:YPTM2 [Symbiodinium natans]
MDPGPPMYTVTLLTLSGSPSAEFELPPATSVGEILQKARATASDSRTQLKLLLQGRALQAKETLCSLSLPPPPAVVELQLICQPRLIERIAAQTSDYQRVSIGICGQRRAGKTSLLNQYIERACVADEFVSVISIDFKVANLRVERDEAFVPVKLLLWDLHGLHRPHTPPVHANMFRHMAAILFVADLDTPWFGVVLNHFDLLESLALDEIQRLLDISAPTSVLERVVVGNKADACAPGSSEAAQSFAGERALPYFETSAKDYESVESAMHQILLSVLDKLELKLTPLSKGPPPPPPPNRCTLL